MARKRTPLAPVPIVTVGQDPIRSRFDRDVQQRINEMVGVTIEITAPTTANQEFGVPHHNLGKKVEEWSIISQDKPGILYAVARERWTPRVSFFRYDQAGGRLTVRLS